MASSTLGRKNCFAVHHGKRNELIIPISNDLRPLPTCPSLTYSTSQGDSIDSGVDLSYSSVDTDDRLSSTSASSSSTSSSSSCFSSSDCDDPATLSVTAKSRTVEAADPDKSENVVNIFCHYDAPDPAAGAQLTSDERAPQVGSRSSHTLLAGVELSSVVEIDGDCVIIHSRQDEQAAPQHDEASSQGTTGTDTDIVTEKCRQFFNNRTLTARSSKSPQTSLHLSNLQTDQSDTAAEQMTSRSSTETGTKDDLVRASSGSLSQQIAQLRHEMSSLVSCDDQLFRQLLQLNNSIQTLRCVGADSSLTPSSSISSLVEVAESTSSCSPSSTLSSSGASSSHYSRISSDLSSHYEVIGESRFTATPASKTTSSDSSAKLRSKGAVAVNGGVSGVSGVSGDSSPAYQQFATLSSGTRFGQKPRQSPNSTTTSTATTSQSSTYAQQNNKSFTSFATQRRSNNKQQQQQQQSQQNSKFSYCTLRPGTSVKATSEISPVSSSAFQRHIRAPPIRTSTMSTRRLRK